MLPGRIRLREAHMGTDLYLRAGSDEAGCDLALIAVGDRRLDGRRRPARHAVRLTWLGFFGAVGIGQSMSVHEITERLAAMQVDPLPLLQVASTKGWEVRALIEQRHDETTFDVETDETGWITLEAWTAEDARALAAAGGLTVLRAQKAHRGDRQNLHVPIGLTCRCDREGRSEEAAYDADDHEYRCPLCGERGRTPEEACRFKARCPRGGA